MLMRLRNASGAPTPAERTRSRNCFSKRWTCMHMQKGSSARSAEPRVCSRINGALRRATRWLRYEQTPMRCAQARGMVDNAMRQARQLITAPLVALRDGAGAGVDIGTTIDLWERWADVAANDDAIALASHLETHGPPLIAAVGDLRRAAAAELERLERAWRPAADAIAAWLPLGRRAQEAEVEAARTQGG